MDTGLKILCAADLSEYPSVRTILENSYKVIYIPASREALMENITDVNAYFASMHVRISEEVLRVAGQLKAISTASTGTDHIDVAVAEKLGIQVLSLKNDREFLNKITATAELTWALILMCVRKIPQTQKLLRQGTWGRDQIRGHQLSGKTLGILGCGRLGSIVAEYGRAFRMKVIGYDVLDINNPNIENVSFDELLKQSDILSIHIHLTEKNKKLINKDVLAKLKPNAVLINTSRGAIIDEAALLSSLQSGHLAAAGLDVIDGEWNENILSHKLIQYSLSNDNLLITPHIGGATYEAQELAYSFAAKKLINFLTNHS
jgi:D-3-phosphoglycerate dehydrogenase